MTCSGDQKVTTMILKVDLQCRQCYNKLKKILCKFPQIRDQIYDDKHNTVIITVVCCSPERIRDKLCSKGRNTIKSIEIKNPNPKPDTAPEKPKPKPPAPVPVPIPIPATKPAEEPPKPAPKPAAPAPAPTPKPAPAPAPKPAPAPEPMAQWVPSYPPCPPPQPVYPVSACCSSCYEGRPGGPCYQEGYGPAPGYGYQYGRPSCPPGYYASRCDYLCEENPSGCSIM